MKPRQAIAAAIFILGLGLSFLFVPLTKCANLGDYDEYTTRSYCQFQGYYLVTNRRSVRSSRAYKIDLDHKLIALEWTVIVLVSVLVGVDFSKLRK